MNKLAVTVAMLGLGLAGQASAVPCGGWMAGGTVPTAGCQAGIAGDMVDTAADLNSGNYFNHNNWTLLDRASDGVNSSLWNLSLGGPGSAMGAFSVANLQNLYSDLVVVLQSDFGRTSAVHWKAYLLPAKSYGQYFWTYDWQHAVSDLTLYARALQPTRVTEPATLALVLTGMLSVAILYRRRVRSRR